MKTIPPTPTTQPPSAGGAGATERSEGGGLLRRDVYLNATRVHVDQYKNGESVLIVVADGKTYIYEFEETPETPDSLRQVKEGDALDSEPNVHERTRTMLEHLVNHYALELPITEDANLADDVANAKAWLASLATPTPARPCVREGEGQRISV